jgi:flagella synthesis protein FlgN
MTAGMSDIQLFVELCRDEVSLVSRLIAFLEQEKTALINGEVLKLEPLADEKSRALEALSGKGAERQALLARLGLTGVTEVRAWAADKPDACDAWVTLEDTLQKALVLNQFNGQVINNGLQNAEQALNVLKTAAASTLSYGRDGSPPVIPIGGRHLGSA